MKKPNLKKWLKNKQGSILALVVIAMVILSALGTGILAVSYGVRHQAIQTRNETAALLAAEAGYEQAVFNMAQQDSMLSALSNAGFAASGSLDFGDSACTYNITFSDFVGSRPVFRIVSVGQCGTFQRTVDVQIVQAISGWDMGMCRVPGGYYNTYPVNFVSGEIIDIPVHINCYQEPDDFELDIHITGDPQFLQTVSMGESEFAWDGSDKYSSVMDCFENGIFFDQPDTKITDSDSLQVKMNAFRQTLAEQKPELIFQPVPRYEIPEAQGAVQLEFFVGDDGEGYVQITEDCTVRGYTRWGFESNTWDYKINPGSGGSNYMKYSIYGYHYIPQKAEERGKRYIRNVADCLVTPNYGGVDGRPGGQIYVDGNVIIGSNDEKALQSGVAQLNTVKGQITIVATGNIWIANSIRVAGNHEADGMPSLDNPNALGLVAQGVVKVVDPGMTTDLHGSDDSFIDQYAEEDENNIDITVTEPENMEYIYEPIGEYDAMDTHYRHLPLETVIEAAITVGGGGWGAEDVQRGVNGGRKEAPGGQNYIVVRGTISEAIRGVVGSGGDGYQKRYYFDKRIMQGILPGDIWMKGKYIPAPAGWSDYR